MKLVEVFVVTDDSTGAYVIGELDFGIPGTTEDWLDGDPDRPKKLADWLRWLADRCEKRESPFNRVPASVLKFTREHTVFNCPVCGTAKCEGPK